MERLQKVMAHRGVASRRACEEIISAGRVAVNGMTVTELGFKVGPDDEIMVDGKVIEEEHKRPVVILLNKPKGVVSTVSDPHAERTVMDLVEQGDRRLYPVGRLDMDSRGLMLMTDDGELANVLLHPSFEAEKVYEVRARGELGQKEIERMSKGVELEDGRTSPARIEDVGIDGDKVRFRIVIKEGKKRQIRRMVRAVGGHVYDLRRVKFAGLELGTLPEGRWRTLSLAEVNALRKSFGLRPYSRSGK